MNGQLQEEIGKHAKTREELRRALENVKELNRATQAARSARGPGTAGVLQHGQPVTDRSTAISGQRL